MSANLIRVNALTTADFKDKFSATTADALGAEFVQAWADFPAARWRTLASARLDDLRMSDRIELLADALVECLPDDVEHAAQIIDGALLGVRRLDDLARRQLCGKSGSRPTRASTGCPRRIDATVLQ